MDFTGTEGNDNLVGTADSDTFDLTDFAGGDPSNGGADTVRGLGDDDEIDFGETFGIGDVANGGGGQDVLFLRDHVDPNVVLDGTNVIGIETISLSHLLFVQGPQATHFNLKFGTGFESSGSKMTIDGQALNDADGLNLDLSGTDRNTEFLIGTGAAHGVVQCGPGNTTVATVDDGHMKVVGGNGNDDFNWSQTAQTASTAFNVNSQYIGGAGNDSLTFSGDMSSGVTFNASTMRSMEHLILMHGFNYGLTLNDANLPNAQQLIVDGRGISGSASFFNFDDSAEAGGTIVILGGGQTAVFKTGVGNDTIHSGAASLLTTITPGAGHDHIFGSTQQDVVLMGSFFDPLDRIDGLSGTNDEVDLDGDYAAGVTLKGATIHNIDIMKLATGHSYRLIFDDGNVAAGKTMLIDGSGLGAANGLFLSGLRETDGQFDFRGGDGNDTFIGGAKDDDFHGGGGIDTFSVGGGSDDIFYEGPVSDSTGLMHDVVKGFDVTNDFIGLNFGVFGQSSLGAGRLRAAVFDSDLATAVNSGVMGSNTSVSFTPNSGNLAGHHFLVIDANGVAGYQAGQDFVIEFVNPVHWGSSFNYFTGA